jgi:hypothetical protein
MAKQPGDRYPHAGVMRDDLRAVLRMSESFGPVPSGPLPARTVSDARRRALVVALVTTIVLGVAALGATYALTRSGDDEPSTDPTTPATSESSTEAPTDSPTTSEPTDTDYTPQDGDEAKAVDVLTEALEGQQGIDPGTAGCVAEALVEKLGVKRMVEAGMLTPDIEINNDPMSGSLPGDVQNAVVGAAFDCALSGLSP